MQASRDGVIEVWRELLERCDASRLVEARIKASLGPPPRLLALGKAAGPMLEGASRALGAKVLEGALAVSADAADPPEGVEHCRGDHPLPGAGSLAAGRRVVAWAAEARAGARPVWVLLSGGASALLELPAEGVSLEALLALHRRLHAAGVSIELMNAARGRVSALKAGGLAALLGEGLRRQLVLVDIPGGEAAWVGSGPCTPPLPWPGGLLPALEREGLCAGLPPAVLDRLAAEPDPAPATPVATEILATPERLVREATALFEARGVPVHPLSGARADLDGVDLAAELAGHLREGEGVLLVAGEAGFDRREGRGAGREAARGGRAGHLGLEVLHRMAGVERPWVCLAGASDGRDGSGEGGAVVGPGHASSADDRRKALAAFASGDFHRRFGSDLPAHPPRTNLCDLYLAWC